MTRHTSNGSECNVCVEKNIEGQRSHADTHRGQSCPFSAVCTDKIAPRKDLSAGTDMYIRTIRCHDIEMIIVRVTHVQSVK